MGQLKASECTEAPQVAPGKITRAQYEVVRDALVKSGVLRRGVTDKEICALITEVRIARRVPGTCQPPNFHKYLAKPDGQPPAFRGELHAALRLDDFGLDDGLWNEAPEKLAARIEQALVGGVHGFLLRQTTAPILTVSEQNHTPLRGLRMDGEPRPALPVRQEFIARPHARVVVTARLPADSHVLLIVEESGTFQVLNRALNIAPKVYPRGHHNLGTFTIDPKPERSVLFCLLSAKPLRPEWIHDSGKLLPGREAFDIVEKMCARTDAPVTADIVSVLVRTPQVAEV